MKTYAIEIRDYKTKWHPAMTGGRLFVFSNREYAVQELERWVLSENKIMREGREQFGVEYRVRPFSGKNLEIKRR
jgi:hypothetical protein